MGFAEEVKMANLNWGEQGNINHFRDQEAENKFRTNFGNKGTKIYFSINDTLNAHGGNEHSEQTSHYCV